MRYKCIRENREICTVTTDIDYAVGDAIEIKLDLEVLEKIKVVDILK